MAVKDSPFYCERIEDAVQWPIYDDDRDEWIARHRARIIKTWLDSGAGQFIESSQNGR